MNELGFVCMCRLAEKEFGGGVGGVGYKNSEIEPRDSFLHISLAVSHSTENFIRWVDLWDSFTCHRVLDASML